jgi:hypothetical protein
MNFLEAYTLRSEELELYPYYLLSTTQTLIPYMVAAAAGASAVPLASIQTSPALDIDIDIDIGL